MEMAKRTTGENWFKFDGGSGVPQNYYFHYLLLIIAHNIDSFSQQKCKQD
jgi:hypothetical protein